MKKVLILMAVAALVSPVMAAITTVTTAAGFGPYNVTPGGEFSVDPTGWNPFPYYAAVAEVTIGSNQYFQTFCLEKSEYISANTTYTVVFNDKAVEGGEGPAGDPLSIGTAYLYHEFQNGTLKGYDYNVLADRLVDAADLQNTIWYLEGEQGAVSNPFTTLLVTQFGSIANAMLDNNGQYGVAVMNLTSSNGLLKQDLLVCVPAPGALLLGSLGMGLVGWLRRRQAV